MDDGILVFSVLSLHLSREGEKAGIQIDNTCMFSKGLTLHQCTIAERIENSFSLNVNAVSDNS